MTTPTVARLSRQSRHVFEVLLCQRARSVDLIVDGSTAQQ